MTLCGSWSSISGRRRHRRRRLLQLVMPAAISNQQELREGLHHTKLLPVIALLRCADPLTNTVAVATDYNNLNSSGYYGCVVTPTTGSGTFAAAVLIKFVVIAAGIEVYVISTCFVFIAAGCCRQDLLPGDGQNPLVASSESRQGC
jgi:hypothetical protein